VLAVEGDVDALVEERGEVADLRRVVQRLVVAQARSGMTRPPMVADQ
jgi:hypothetical protein